MDANQLRAHYLTWFRRALPAALLPLALTALVQWAGSAPWWQSGPPAPGSVRYLFIAVAIAGVVVGRTVRERETALRPLTPARLTSLSWQLLTHALAPAVIGAVLAFMTRTVWDFYALLLASLFGLGILFPRFDQWVVWSGQPIQGAAAPGRAPTEDAADAAVSGANADTPAGEV